MRTTVSPSDEADNEGEREGKEEGSDVCVGLFDGFLDTDGCTVGEKDGTEEAVGIAVGAIEGLLDGKTVGDREGDFVIGILEGVIV
jgi:hypothetical protein